MKKGIVGEGPPIPGHPNLKPYKKGQTGNPAGRPPGKRLEDYVRDLLHEEVKINGERKTRLEIVAALVVREVMKPTSPVFREMLDRLWPKESKVSGSVNVTSQELPPLTKAAALALRKRIEEEEL